MYVFFCANADSREIIQTFIWNREKKPVLASESVKQESKKKLSFVGN